jgi:hypothetical protein
MADSRQRTRHPVADGVLAGLGAGGVFIVAEMIINAVLGKPFFGPLRLIGSIVLGPQALDPSYPFRSAIISGLIVHLVLSIVFSFVFLFLVITAKLSRGTSELMLLGFAYGVILWIVNFYLIAPKAFPQFANVTPFWNGFLAHSVFYGIPLGWCYGTGRVGPGFGVEDLPAKEKRYGTA